MLAALRPDGPGAAAAVPALLPRQLPPAQDQPQARDGASSSSASASGGSALAPEASLLQLHALALRRCCASLACPAALAGPAGGPPKRGKRCTGCQEARYCSSACQSSDWRAHKAACRVLEAQRADA